MTDNDKGKMIPAYVPYKTLRTFFVTCKEILPSRIDRSFWGGKLAGGTGGMLMAGLAFLDLIDEMNSYGKPT